MTTQKERVDSAAHARAVRAARIAGGDFKVGGGRMTNARRQYRAARQLADLIGVDDLEELVELFKQEGAAAFKPLRPAAIKALAEDLKSQNPQVRSRAVARVLDMTDGKPRAAPEERDEPSIIAFETTALGESNGDKAFSFDD